MAEDTGNNLSSRLGQIVVEGMEEIIGRSGVTEVLRSDHMARSHPGGTVQVGKANDAHFSEVSSIQLSLETIYGSRGGQGIALRAGRASFKHILRLYGATLGLTNLNFRLLPAPVRLRRGLDVLMTLFSDLEGGPVEIEQLENAWLWHSRQCPFCWQRESDEPICTFTVGLLQEFLAWNSGGKVFHVEEIECRAKGKAACIYRIDAQPLD